MGVVYRAVDTHLDRPVAIKVLRPEATASPERKGRFVQEAKAASALNHPNIIHVYDIDTANGTDFIAMEFVPGRTLDQCIGRSGLSLSDILKYGIQIADALAQAHAAGIVHRNTPARRQNSSLHVRPRSCSLGPPRGSDAAVIRYPDLGPEQSRASDRYSGRKSRSRICSELNGQRSGKVPGDSPVSRAASSTASR